MYSYLSSLGLYLQLFHHSTPINDAITRPVCDVTGFEPIIAKNVQKINFKFTMISIFTTLLVKTSFSLPPINTQHYYL